MTRASRRRRATALIAKKPTTSSAIIALPSEPGAEPAALAACTGLASIIAPAAVANPIRHVAICPVPIWQTRMKPLFAAPTLTAAPAP